MARYGEDAHGRGDPRAAARTGGCEQAAHSDGRADRQSGRAADEVDPGHQGRLELPDAIKAAIPEEATTIHRLLGSVPDSPYFWHNLQRPLLADVVIVDEASMVDLPLMAKLFEAVPGFARIILLGDKNQLASVEAGRVLGDLCNSGEAVDVPRETLSLYAEVSGETVGFKGESARAPIQQNLAELRKNHRFPDTGGIYRISALVNDGKAADALALIKENTLADLAWRELPDARQLARALREKVVAGYGDYLRAAGPQDALVLLSSGSGSFARCGAGLTAWKTSTRSWRKFSRMPA